MKKLIQIFNKTIVGIGIDSSKIARLDHYLYENINSEFLRPKNSQITNDINEIMQTGRSEIKEKTLAKLEYLKNILISDFERKMINNQTSQIPKCTETSLDLKILLTAGGKICLPIGGVLQEIDLPKEEDLIFATISREKPSFYFKSNQLDEVLENQIAHVRLIHPSEPLPTATWTNQKTETVMRFYFANEKQRDAVASDILRLPSNALVHDNFILNP